MRRAWIWISRTLARLTPPLIVVGAVWALLQADAANRLGYAKALAWPIVVVFVVLMLREPIRERIGSIQRASGLGVDFEMERRAELEQRSNEELQNTAREVAATVLPDEDPEPAPPPALDDAANEPDDPGQLTVDDVKRIAERATRFSEAARRHAEVEQQQRRQALEDALEAGAIWGYNMATLYASPPKPIISWDIAGQPNIVGASGARRRTAAESSDAGSRRAAIAALEFHQAQRQRDEAVETLRRLEARHMAATESPEREAIREQLDAARAARVDADRNVKMARNRQQAALWDEVPD